MHRTIICISTICFLLGAGTLRADAGAYMPVDDLQRGMKGIGRTVFQGTEIDTFQVEILGVLRNVFGPKSDIILARLSGGPLAQTGVIAGMSGSPVYIDGKMIGAVSYSIGSFVKEPIAGITPIGEMMSVLNRTETDTVSQTNATPGRWDGLAEATGIEGATLTPVAVPLMFSGFAPEAIGAFRDQLMHDGLLPVQGGGGSDPSLPVGVFEPGAPLGVQLIRGDFSVTGIGTLTQRVGDRVVGFGHPMLFGGNTAMPMTAAYIHEVVASQMQSFKLGVASQPMGVILQDRAPGIAGVVGSKAQMMPVRIDVQSPGNAESFHMEVLRNRELGPVLVNMALTSSLMSAEKQMGEATVNGAVTIGLRGRAPLTIEDVFSGPQGLGMAVMSLMQPLARVMQNPFEPAHIDSVVFHLTVEERTRSAQIAHVRLSEGQFEPGDTVHVSVTLTPVRSDTETVGLDLVLPRHMSKGRALLQVMSAHHLAEQDAKRAPGAFEPENLSELLGLLSRPSRNDDLVVELLGTQPSVTVDGREVALLPESVLSALALSRESGVVQQARQTVLAQVHRPTHYVLTGTQTMLLSVGKEGDGLMFTGKGGSGEEKQ